MQISQEKYEKMVRNVRDPLENYEQLLADPDAKLNPAQRADILETIAGLRRILADLEGMAPKPPYRWPARANHQQQGAGRWKKKSSGRIRNS